MKIDKLFKQYFFPVDSLIFSILMIVFGVVLAIWPGLATQIILWASGIVLLGLGVYRMIKYLKGDPLDSNTRFDLTISLTLLAGGCVLLFMPKALASIVPVVLGISLIIGGLIKVQAALDMMRMKEKYWYIVLIASALAIALGVVALCNPFTVVETLMMFIGIAMVVEGVMDIITNYRLGKVRKAFKEAAKPVSSEESSVE